VQVQEFSGRQGKVVGVRGVDVRWTATPGGRPRCTEQPGTTFELPADLVLVAVGFVPAPAAELSQRFGLETGDGGWPVLDGNGMSTSPGVFVAGDLALGPSLVVKAIADGRRVAASVEAYLGRTVRAAASPAGAAGHAGTESERVETPGVLPTATVRVATAPKNRSDVYSTTPSVRDPEAGAVPKGYA